MDRIVKILFIDCEEAEYLLLAELLSQIHHTDYQLVWHDQLDGALPAIFRDDYDLVLLDYYWGDKTARDLLAAAKTQSCTTPIVVMTGEREVEVDSEAIRAGAADYLIKGQINTELLERTLRYAIERKRSEQRLSRLAHYDTLTDIPNRVLFRDRLEHAISLAERDQGQFTLMFIDLNGFKQVNDSFGHDTGDAVIRVCAQRLQECIRSSDSVARMGGDEFTLLMESTDNGADIAHVAEKIIESISAAYQIGGYDMSIGCSIGIAVYPEAGLDAETLLRNADFAMYQAKQQEDSSYRFFTEAMNREVRRQLRLESELRAAVNRNQLSLEYQPRVNPVTGAIVAMEALLRWEHPERGALDAKEFINVAEDTGLINELGYWIVEQACKDLLRLEKECELELLMAINFSVRQFRDEHLVHRIASILSDLGVAGKRLEFELTEASLMDNLELVALCMRPLSHLGIRFSLDDFGSGFCSFLQLHRLPIGSVKIDAQFMSELNQSPEDQQLVSTIINLAHNLNKTVIAESVETAEQKEWLLSAGCDQMQGYYFCAPQAAHRVCEALQSECHLTLPDE